MKAYLFTMIAAAASFALAAHTHAADLSIEVSNVQSTQGSIWVRVFAQADDFLKQSVQRVRAQPLLGTTTVLVKGLEPGVYAFALHHDINDNGKLDTGLFGMPSEPYGFSNNAKGSMGPPKFEQAKFSLPATGTGVKAQLR